jgi:hypothetical protein
MSATKVRVLQYIVIILILALASGAGYALYRSKAAVTQKSASKDGLVGYWRFEENTGTAAGDMSGNGNTGTLTNGPTWVDGKNGKAVNFDGTNDYVSAGSPALLDDIATLTTCAWINPETLPADGAYRIIDEKTSGTGGWAFLVYNSSGTLVPGLYRDFSTYDGYWFGTQGIALNTWTHVCLAYDNSSVSNDPVFYINGASISATEVYTPIGTASSDAASTLVIGAYTSAYYFDGSIDEVRMYNRVLSVTEIAAVYGAGVAEVSTSQTGNLTNGLAGIWSFDGTDISGTTAYDRSGNANNGTLTAGPVVAKGKIGQALNFDGTDDYITAGSPASLDDIATLTTCAWVYPETMPSLSGYRIIDRKTSGSAGGWEFWLYNNNGYLVPGVYRYFSSTDGHWFGDADITVGAWSHLCVTYNSSSASNDPVFYVNGVPIATTEYTAPAGTADSDAGEEFRIAWSPSSGFFDGPIDDVRVYNRIFSASEIWDLYQLGASDKINAAGSQLDLFRSGLAAYWKLDENTGTSAADAGTSGKSGTLTNGPTWTTGRIGSGVTFDGTNDYIDIGSSSTLADNLSRFSVSTWFKTSATDCVTVNCAIVSKLSTGSTNTGVGWLLSGNYNGNSLMGQIWFFVQGPTGSYWRSRYTVNQYNDGQWHHALVTFDNSTIVIYIDGVAVDLSADDGGALGSFSNAANVRIGADTDGSYFPGSVDEVRIYDRVLSAEEAAKLYKTTVPDDPDTGLKGYWGFNGVDVSGTTAYDRSGAGINGVLTNGAAPTIGKIGQAINFDGVDDYINVPSAASTDNMTALTLCAWVNPSASQNESYPAVVSKANGTTIFWDLYLTNGASSPFGFGTSFNNSIWKETDTHDVYPGEWSHICGVQPGTSPSAFGLYVNGGLINGTSGGTGSRPSDTGEPIEIGFDPVDGFEFVGKMDEVRVYNRALSASEILDLYNKGK